MDFYDLKPLKVNGKYGWVDKDNHFVIQPLYDSPCARYYNGIVILQKNGYEGGVFLDSGRIAFQFQYRQLGWMYNETFQSINSDGTVTIIKPGDKELSSHKYSRFYFNDNQRYIRFVRRGFLGSEIEGVLDLETGEEQ